MSTFLSPLGSFQTGFRVQSSGFSFWVQTSVQIFKLFYNLFFNFKYSKFVFPPKIVLKIFSRNKKYRTSSIDTHRIFSRRFYGKKKQNKFDGRRELGEEMQTSCEFVKYKSLLPFCNRQI
jgi:hypothetical protein